MVSVGSAIPLWVSVPTVSLPVFIGTRSVDEYGHAFYQYFTGTSANSLQIVSAIDTEAIDVANITSVQLLPFVDPAALVPFVPIAKMRLLNFGLERREHLVLSPESPDERWWLHTPIAEVNKLVIDGKPVDYEIRDSVIYVGGTPITQIVGGGKSVLLISCNSFEIHYAIGRQTPMVDEALIYFVAAAYLRAASNKESGVYESIRVGAVSFSFRPIKELRDRAIQLEKIGLQILRSGGLM